MIDLSHPRLSIARQCRLVAISRSAFYGPAKGESSLNLALMRLIDEPVSWRRPGMVRARWPGICAARAVRSAASGSGG